MATEQLATTLNQNMQDLLRFIDECDEFFTAEGQSDEYLLDICATRTGYCIDSTNEKTSHVSCCCGFNPVLALGQDVIQMAGATSTHGVRRLSLPQSSYDLCAEAWTGSSQYVAQAHEDIRNLGQGSIIDKHETKMKDAYGNSYCSFEDEKTEAFRVGTASNTEWPMLASAVTTAIVILAILRAP